MRREGCTTLRGGAKRGAPSAPQHTALNEAGGAHQRQLSNIFGRSSSRSPHPDPRRSNGFGRKGRSRGYTRCVAPLPCLRQHCRFSIYSIRQQGPNNCTLFISINDSTESDQSDTEGPPRHQRRLPALSRSKRNNNKKTKKFQKQKSHVSVFDQLMVNDDLPGGNR